MSRLFCTTTFDKRLSEGLESFIAGVQSAVSIEQVFIALEKRLQELELPYYAYVLLFPSSHIFQLCITNYPINWFDHYVSSKFAQIDLVPKLSMELYKPFIWSDEIAKHDLSKKQMLVMQDSAEAGLVSGATIPIGVFSNERGFVSVASDVSRKQFQLLFEQVQYELGLLSLHVHDKVLELKLKESLPKDVQLSLREADVLTWAAQGKSTFEISVILDISANLVKDTLTSARTKLKCSNTTHAIAIAIYHKLISPVECCLVIKIGKNQSPRSEG